jgi:hypothetical protein
MGRDSLHGRVLRVFNRLVEWTAALDGRRAGVIVGIAIACLIVVKAVLAWTGIGFFSGDDVEVQEMSLRALWHSSWPIWDLRSPLFPLGVTYPAHRLATMAGWQSPGALVWAGRMPVVLLSSVSVWLVWRVLRRKYPLEPGWGAIGALAYGTSHLHVAFGSSELPRPVATVLVLGAFVLLSKPSLRPSCAAAALVGLAASLRFSEALFVVPAVVQLMIGRRWFHAGVFVAVAFATGVAAIAIADVYYWGAPFHSVSASIDYTLVKGLSSRGYQSIVWYFAHIPQWVTPSVFVLAVVGTVRTWSDEALWAWLPVLMLSALPHKEARYLIPAVPFVYLLAIQGLRGILVAGADPRGWKYESLPFALAAAIVLGMVYDVGHWKLPRTNGDVELARRIARDLEPGGGLVAEQAWRLGGHVYFGSRPLTDLPPELLSTSVLAGQLTEDPWVVLDSRRSGYPQLRALLEARRYIEYPHSSDSTYRVWRPKH